MTEGAPCALLAAGPPVGEWLPSPTTAKIAMSAAAAARPAPIPTRFHCGRHRRTGRRRAARSSNEGATGAASAFVPTEPRAAFRTAAERPGAASSGSEAKAARDLCEKLLGYASPLHLYAEEIDPRSGRHFGNFPQAFTHLALINAVMHVIRKEQAAQRRAMGREVPEGEE